MITLQVPPGLAVRVGIALRAYAQDLRRAGVEPPPDVVALAESLQPDRVATRTAEERARELAAARCRRSRARKRGDPVPLRRPGPPPGGRQPARRAS